MCFSQEIKVDLDTPENGIARCRFFFAQHTACERDVEDCRKTARGVRTPRSEGPRARRGLTAKETPQRRPRVPNDGVVWRYIWGSLPHGFADFLPINVIFMGGQWG